MGLTTDIFLETQVFVTNNFDLRRTAFKELVQLVKQDRVRVYLTTVTVGEVKKQIDERVRSAATVIDNIRKEVRILANSQIPETAARARHLDIKLTVAELISQFDKFIDETRAEIIDLENVDPGVVFEKYFSIQAPFERRKEKRNEFPDAFSIEALKLLRDQANIDLRVVTGDKGFKTACEVYGIPVLQTVEEFLDLENTRREEKVTAHVVECFARKFDAIKQAIHDEFQNVGFYLDEVEGDVDAVTVKEVTLDDPLVISILSNSAILECSVEVQFAAEISYDDPNAIHYDDEDGKKYVFNTIDETVNEKAEFPVEITVHFDSLDPTFCDFEIGKLNNGDDVVVQPQRYSDY
jgi:hypothetical protein